MDNNTSSGNSTRTSSGSISDFEIIDTGNSAASCIQPVLSAPPCEKEAGDSSMTGKSSQDSYEEPKLSIANNGNLEDLQKHMSEVLRDAKNNSEDSITREDDPAILKSLDASPESDLSSPANKTCPKSSSSAPCSARRPSEGILHSIREAVASDPLSVLSPLTMTAAKNSSVVSASNETALAVPDKPDSLAMTLTDNLENKASVARLADTLTTPTVENPLCEDYTIFNQVLYLGAAAISPACTQEEILLNMSFLNSQVGGSAIEVSLSVPSHSEGFVIIYDAINKMEITKYPIFTIRKCTRGQDHSHEASCFTFTTIHGSSPATSIVQCHVFRCQIPEAVGRIVDSFGLAFRRLPKSSQLSAASAITSDGSTMMLSADAVCSTTKKSITVPAQKYMFDIALEIKEEDSKGNYTTVPRDKECFKLRCNVNKEVCITVTPSPNQLPYSSTNNADSRRQSAAALAGNMTIERCFGLLIASGHKVKDADMNLLDMVMMGLSGGAGSLQSAPTSVVSSVHSGSPPTALLTSHSNTCVSYVASGRWDPQDAAFIALNQESPKDGRALMSVAVDLVMKGIQEPVRFVMETKVRVFPQNERFWYYTKKPLVNLFCINLKQADLSPTSSTAPDGLLYEVVSLENLGEIERFSRPSLAAGLSLPLNLSSFSLSTLSGGMRSPSIASVETPYGDEEGGSDDDEPLLSGSGEVSKDCPQSELDEWKLVLPKWQSDPAHFPKGVAKLVKRGVPEALRGEVWQLLAGCSNDQVLMDSYRILLTKDCPSDQVILRDINRTFPAHDFFKDAGGGGQDALYKISRAYAVYDEELAYCQGLSFLAASLLLHMPEEQAFCVLVKIMSDYGFRNLFKDGFEVLHLRFYQLDRLMEDYLPDVHSHFQALGVATHMFASQWFLTLYTAKFPLYMVFHALDLFLLLGFESVFQVALALLTMSRKELTALDFEGVLRYFRVQLPKKYRHEDSVKQLFRFAITTKVKRLQKYQNEYVAIKEQESAGSAEVRLEQENRKLLEDKLRLDAENDALARRIDQLEEMTERLHREVTALKQELTETEQERSRLTQEAVQVKELLKREVEHSDEEQKRSSAMVAEYKTICAELSQRLDDQKAHHLLEVERIKASLELCTAMDCQCLSTAFPNTSNSPASKCSKSIFLSASDIEIAAEGGEISEPRSASLDRLSSKSADANSDIIGSLGEDRDPTVRAAWRSQQLSSLNSHIRELELELAQTKLALVETQCKNQDVTHQLNSAISELQSKENSWFQKTLTSISSLRDRPAGVGATTSRPLSPSLSSHTFNSLNSAGSSSGVGSISAPSSSRAALYRASSVESSASLSSSLRRCDAAGVALP